MVRSGHGRRRWRFPRGLFFGLFEQPRDMLMGQNARQWPSRRRSRDIERGIIRPLAFVEQKGKELA